MSRGKEELKQLLEVLTKAVDNIIGDPDVSVASIHSSEPTPPVMNKDSAAVTLAAAQMIAQLNGPAHGLNAAFFIHVPHCLRVAIAAHVAEVLREACEPLHATEIAKRSGTAINADKLARVLRLLAGHHFFSETAPDTFANNLCSTGLDTGKAVADLQDVTNMYAGSNGFAALISHTTDEISKSSSYLADYLLDPVTAHASRVDQTPFQTAHRTSKVCWEWIAQDTWRVNRFASAMCAVNSLGGGVKGVTFDDGFDFRGLKDGATLVDVGSGVGAASLVLHAVAPRINLVLQDRPEVISGETTKAFEVAAPDALKSGQIKLQAHDFFTPQPVKQAEVYFLRAIIHDWPDDEAKTILKHLADSAAPHTQLVVIEHVVTSLAPNATDPPTVLSVRAPPTPYHLDMQMLCALNAQERTTEQFERLFRSTGWDLKRVGRGAPDAPHHFICHLAREMNGS
ncbi:hypothetical protein ACM66B_001192 [Microbotryomycetes sp. NB124-2]